MSVRRRQNWLGQQRVDVPHLKSIESAVSNDFDELISGLVIGENKSYVVRGFEINMPGAIGSSANGLQLIVADTSILHGASNESGTFYNIPTGTPAEILSSTTNDRVEGAFTPSTDNYIGVEFVREVDDATVDQVYFWNPTTNVEITKTVPLALILDYKVVISTSSFASNVLPVAIVQTDASNNVISITDRRPLLLRLGTAGDSDPNPFYEYPWADGRAENFYTSTSSTSSPFQGGDKQIKNLKEFFDALMTEIKILKGTPYWYSEAPGSITNSRGDLANTAFTGKGQVIHGQVDFQGQVAGMTTDVVIKVDGISDIDTITLVADSIKDIDTLISEWNAANPEVQILLYSGDGSQIPTVNIELSSKAGQINWNSDIYLRFIGGRLSYKILANEASTEVTLADDQVAYIQLVRGEDVTPPLVFTNGGTVVTSVGNVSWTDDVEPGDFIKDASKGDEFYYEIASVDSLSQVTLTIPFQESSSGPGGFDAQYAWGTYETNPLPSTPRHVFISDRDEMPFGENFFWLFLRSDDGSAVPRVYARVLGGAELEQGEARGVADNTSQAIIDYIGSAGQYDNTPNYTNATGSAITNFHLIDDESLTLGMKRLEHRDDVIPRVRVIDILSTSLPVGASVDIDGETLINGDYVFFTNSAIEGLYKVSGVGTAVAFEKMYAFKGSQTSVNGDLIRVEDGTSYFSTVWKRIANEWKPLEVKEATKEPTGYPNRVDSEISFDDPSRTFSVGPKAPATFFDVFAKGKPYRFDSAQSIAIPDVEGIYFFYFETDGTLAYSTVFDISIITEKIYTATIYWDATNKSAILIGDERHGLTMDSATHEYLHNKNGTIITNGGTIGFDPTADGSEDNDAQISLSDMTIRDEDIRIDIANNAAPSEIFEQILDPIAEIPVFYRSGASGYWRKDVATQFPVKQGVSRIQYNNPAGPWTTEDIPENTYMSMWIYATNSINEPVIAVLGQDYHASLSQAQSDDEPNTLLLGNLPTQEYKLLYRIIFHSSAGFANTPKAHVADVRDLRAVEDTTFAQVSPNDHGLLSGLADPDHAPTAVTTSGVTLDGAFSAADVDAANVFDTVNKLLGQLRLKPHPTDGHRVVVTGAERILNNNTTLIQELRNLILDFDGAEINFETGVIYQSDGISALGIDFVPFAIGANEYFNYSVTLIASAVNADNTISGQILILPAANSDAVLANAPKAPFANGIKLGQVWVQEDAGGIADITFDNISQLGTGGGSGGGTGDANELLERLKNHLDNGEFDVVTPNIIVSVEDDLLDEIATTASFDIVGGTMEYKAIGEVVQSIQMLDATFLTEDKDIGEAKLVAYWQLDAIDNAATYELSRDGGNEWQAVTMERIGGSDTYEGKHVFTEETSYAETILNDVANADSSLVFSDTIVARSQIFTVTDYAIYKNLWAYLAVTGTIQGSLTVRIVRDDAGSPSTDANDIVFQSTPINLSALSAGNNNVEVSLSAPLAAGDYHIVYLTNLEYRDNYSAAVNELAIRTDASAPVVPVSKESTDGTTYSATAEAFVYRLEGRAPDLRVRITSSQADVKLAGYGIFYDKDDSFAFADIGYKRQLIEFSGDDNINEFTVSEFTPDPILMTVYEIETGASYRKGSFSVSGGTVTFPANTFNKPGETITLEFLQVFSGSQQFDAKNRALLAENNLGSLDPSLDLSQAGLGVILRRPDGTLRMLTINDDDNIEIKTVP
jgi:hypothetical protein